MNPVGGSYDENLLREAPAATREQLQEGYNPDLLVAPTRHKSIRHQSPGPSTPPGAAPPALPTLPHPHASDMEQGNVVSTGKSSHSYDLLREKPEGSGQTPFWRSTNGKILIGAVVALVIIGAVVGGAVGGTVGKANSHKSSNDQSSGSSPLAATGNDNPSGAAQVGSTSSTALSAFPITLTNTQSASGRFSLPTAGLPTAGFQEFGNGQGMGSYPTTSP